MTKKLVTIVAAGEREESRVFDSLAIILEKVQDYMVIRR